MFCFLCTYYLSRACVHCLSSPSPVEVAWEAWSPPCVSSSTTEKWAAHTYKHTQRKIYQCSSTNTHTSCKPDGNSAFRLVRNKHWLSTHLDVCISVCVCMCVKSIAFRLANPHIHLFLTAISLVVQFKHILTSLVRIVRLSVPHCWFTVG